MADKNYLDSLPAEVRERVAQLLGREVYEQAGRLKEHGKKLVRKRAHLARKLQETRDAGERRAIKMHGLENRFNLDDTAIAFLEKKRALKVAKRIRKAKVHK
jgi:hypothetical protein